MRTPAAHSTVGKVFFLLVSSGAAPLHAAPPPPPPPPPPRLEGRTFFLPPPLFFFIACQHPSQEIVPRALSISCHFSLYLFNSIQFNAFYFFIIKKHNTKHIKHNYSKTKILEKEKGDYEKRELEECSPRNIVEKKKNTKQLCQLYMY